MAGLVMLLMKWLAGWKVSGWEETTRVVARSNVRGLGRPVHVLGPSDRVDIRSKRHRIDHNVHDLANISYELRGGK